MGALGRDPKFQLATDLQGLLKQRNDPKNAANRQAISKAIAAARQQPGASGAAVSPQYPTYDSINGQGNQAMQNTLGQIQSRGDFNPGTFGQQQDDAYGHVVDQFNRTNQPAFDKQEKDWQQMAAERGWDLNNKDVQAQHQMAVTDPQNTARLNASDQAYGQGLAAQQQGYNQASQTYQMPYQNLASFNPYYAGQTQFGLQNGQEQWQGGQNALDRQNQRWIVQNSPHGGGGGGGPLSLADQMALQNNSFYNNLALLGAQGGQGTPQQSVGNGFAQGIGDGTAAAIGSMLR